MVQNCNRLLKMAKRHCTMTADEVLAMMEVSDSDMSEASSDERSDDELDLDDPDEPIMEGSDDDFVTYHQ